MLCLAFFFITVSTWAMCRTQTLKAMSEDATRALEQKDSDQIREIFNDPALDGKTKAERAFKVAMTARLKDLPVLDQKKIWESVENAVHDIDEKIYGLARSNGRITITGPE